MGLFSSKKKHYVDTAVVRVVEDGLVPNVMRTAVVEAMFKDYGITETIMENVLQGSFRKIERAYRWAKVPGNYAHGLPDVHVQSSSDGKAKAIQAIRSDIGFTPTIDYLHYRPLNNIHMGWIFAKDQWGHDEETNRLDALSAYFGVDIYLDKMVAVHNVTPGQEPEQSSLGNFGGNTQGGSTPERDWAEPDNASELDKVMSLDAFLTEEEVKVGANEVESVELHYIWKTDDGIHRGVHVLDLSSYDLDREYYHARYTYDPGSGKRVGYWLYDTEDERHPDLDSVFDITYTSPGTYFPFVVFRSEQQNYADPSRHDTDEYKSTVELADRMGFDYQSMSDQIHKNDDVGDIRQAVMMMAVPITTQDPLQMEYLYRWFTALHDRLPNEATSSTPTVSGISDLSAASDDSYAITISDADFSCTISFDKITRRLRSGKVCDVGDFTNDQGTGSTDISDRIAMNPFDLFPSHSFNTRNRTIRKQLNEHVYEEVVIENPQFRFPIARGGKKKTEGGADDERLLIPLDYNICQEFSPLEREDLYYRSLQLVFNSHIVQKVKWYQREAFAILLIVVAIVWTIFTYGGDGGSALSTALGLTAGTNAAIAAAIVQSIVVNIVIGKVLAFAVVELANIVGIEFVQVLAVVAFLYGGYSLAQNNFVMNSTAENMLVLSSGLVEGGQQFIGGEIGALQKEQEEFMKAGEGLYEELEALKAALDSGIDLDPFVFVAEEPLIVFGETPANYYDRTIHSGNVGAKALNLVQNFAEISLRLPTIEETLGEREYG